MKLRSLALNQFKKFTTPTRLDGIADGLNVVVGPNEMGKSTLLCALCAALFEKFSSKAQPIIALQNDRNQAGPVVELCFELEDGEYRITKRFIKKPYARLCCPDGRVLEGDAAEDMLRTLLGFDEPGKTGAKAETLGMWNVLWVQQGHSFGAVDLPPSARSNLHAALESEVGAVLGGRRGQALPKSIENQLGELVTATNRPRGTYKALIEHSEDAKSQLQDLQARRLELSATLQDLENAQETLARLSNSERDQVDQNELNEARQRHRPLVELESHVVAAASDLEVKSLYLERARQAQGERFKLRQTIGSEVEAMEAANTRLEEVRQLETNARSNLGELRTAIRSAEANVSRVDKTISEQRRILEAIDRELRIRELEGRCKKAHAAESRQRESQKLVAASQLSDQSIVEIRNAAKALEIIEGRLNAAATQIVFNMAQEGFAGIEIDGQELTSARSSVQAVEPTTIMIPDRGQITIEPAIKDREKLLSQHRESKARLTTALRAAGAKSMNDAENQYTIRQKLLQDIEFARHEAEVHAPAVDGRDAGGPALSAHIHGLWTNLARELAELQMETLPDRMATESALQVAREQAEEARRDVDIARAALSGPEATLSRLQTELGTVTSRYDDCKERLEMLRSQLADAEVLHSDNDLNGVIETALAAVSHQQSILADLKAQRTEESVPQLEARITRLEKAMVDKRDKRGSLKETIAGLRSRVEALEGAGLDEAIQQKAYEFQVTEEERSRAEREVAVLSLLLVTLRAAEHNAKQLYLSPVLNRVRPYLQVMFPGAEITIDENLHIVGVIRRPGYEEAFDHLSMGTQEQIAVLIRLAFAEMLVEQGHPATVVLDDALVFSDDRRMSRMFDILSMAARNVQIIIFTCREQLFEGLGGQTLALKAGSAEELVSA